MFPIGLNTLATPVLSDEENSALWGATGRSSLMDTQAWLNKETGYILGVTTTRNLNWEFGFTGAVGLLVFDFNGAPILRTETHAFGVDARGLFLKPSARTDSWEQYIDVTTAQSAAQLRLPTQQRLVSGWMRYWMRSSAQVKS